MAVQDVIRHHRAYRGDVAFHPGLKASAFNGFHLGAVADAAWSVGLRSRANATSGRAKRVIEFSLQ